MEAVEFKEQNVVFAKDQPEYRPLPAFKADTPQGEVISCYKLSWRERLQVLITGRLWVSLLSFNKPLTPQFLSVYKSEMFVLPPARWRHLIQKFFSLKFLRSAIFPRQNGI